MNNEKVKNISKTKKNKTKKSSSSPLSLNGKTLFEESPPPISIDYTPITASYSISLRSDSTNPYFSRDDDDEEELEDENL